MFYIRNNLSIYIKLKKWGFCVFYGRISDRSLFNREDIFVEEREMVNFFLCIFFIRLNNKEKIKLLKKEKSNKVL